MSKKLTTEEFIERAKDIHGDKYDYSLVEYKTNRDKVKIICKNCGKVFEQTPKKHLKGRGCPHCVADRIKNHMLQKYGVENPFQAEEIKCKIRLTNLERYGVEMPSQSKEIYAKMRETFITKYSVDNPQKNAIIKNKTRNTCLEKYGEAVYSKTKEYKVKSKKTKLKKYGNENYNNLDKAKQTNLERYGVENTFQVKEYKEKARCTCKERYGVEFYSQTKEYKIKVKQTCLEKYGVESASCLKEVQIKVHNTKKLNNTYGKSKDEDKIFKLLIEKFSDVKRQYRSSIYPFLADFYIPGLDIYIEYQGHWTHGKCKSEVLGPYDQNNKHHQETLKEWQKKAITKLSYKNAINVWTIRDPLKRKTAKNNSLHWFEFFTLKEFIDWYNSIIYET